MDVQFNPAGYPESRRLLIAEIQRWALSIGGLGSALYRHGTTLYLLFCILLLISVVLIPLSKSKDKLKSTVLQLS
jgi:hypothetical protein